MRDIRDYERELLSASDHPKLVRFTAVMLFIIFMSLISIMALTL